MKKHFIIGVAFGIILLATSIFSSCQNIATISPSDLDSVWAGAHHHDGSYSGTLKLSKSGRFVIEDMVFDSNGVPEEGALSGTYTKTDDKITLVVKKGSGIMKKAITKGQKIILEEDQYYLTVTGSQVALVLRGTYYYKIDY